MKKIISIVIAAACVLALFAGCSAKAPEAASEDGNVSLDGSTSMEKVIGSLGESFTNSNPGTSYTYNPTGSGSGIKAVSEGTCDIGLSSRNLKDDEKA